MIKSILRIIQKINAEEDSFIKRFKNTSKILYFSFIYRKHLLPFLNASSESEVGQMINNRPTVLGVLVWPYQCASWGVSERLKRVASHYEMLEKIGSPFSFPATKYFTVLELDDVKSGLCVLIDEAAWLKREGLLSFNLFINELRIYSITFSFSKGPVNELDVIIGGIQGRNITNIMSIYKALTKLLHRQRPRDFLIEIFRTFCREIGVDNIYAIADEFRYHRHPYFGEKNFGINYDTIWLERSGVKDSEQFYKLSTDKIQKPILEIKSNKRSLYRKRYQFLDNCEVMLKSNVVHIRLAE